MPIARTILFYITLLVQVRLMGKRQLGQMEPSEFVVAILIANLASIPIENPEVSVWSGLVPMAVILMLERSLSWICLKSIRLRRLFCGKPVILIDNGTLLHKNLRRTRINLDELSDRLREQGALDISEVRYAILETSGNISVFLRSDSSGELPYTLISDGRLLKENLSMLGRDAAWLKLVLDDHQCSQNDVLLLTATKSGKTSLILRSSDSANY